MKKLFCLFYILIVIFCENTIVNAEDTVDVYINGKKLVTDQPAIVYQDRTMVPLRAICEALGCEVNWNSESQTVNIDNKFVHIAMQIGNYFYSRMEKKDYSYAIHEDWSQTGQHTLPIDVPPIIYNGRTLIPARAVAESINAKVKWNERYKRVDITMNYDAIADFRGDLAVVYSGGKYGCIDRFEKEVIPIKFDGICGSVSDSAFDSDYYKATIEAGYFIVKQNENYGCFDKYGTLIIPVKYKWISHIGDNTFSVEDDSGEYAVFDTDGNIVFPFGRFEYIFEFNNGIAMVAEYGTEHGLSYDSICFVDKNGKVVKRDQYDFIKGFSLENEGAWAIVENDGETFCIDQTGKKREYRE